MADFVIRTTSSIQQIPPAIWEQLGGELPFQSQQWYAFGERVMADCLPVYILLYDANIPIARAVCWVVRYEPLPLPRLARWLVSGLLKRRPLLICRSPLAQACGLFLPEGPLRAEALISLTQAARHELTHQRGSFLVFDFLPTVLAHQTRWPSGFLPLTVSDPGTAMTVEWESFEAYLASGKSRRRQNYRYSMRQAEEQGLRLSKHHKVRNLEEALRLIGNVYRRHASAPDPWMRRLLENLEMVDSTWQEVHRQGQLVGCCVLLRDGGVQLGTALGMAEGIPGVYFLLMYAAVQEAIERGMRTIRLGSGAYDVKRRLGFLLEETNHAVVTGAGFGLRWLMRMMSV